MVDWVLEQVGNLDLENFSEYFETILFTPVDLAHASLSILFFVGTVPRSSKKIETFQ